ncbi:Hypothetical predicted protein [Octopus vulgaris]|uniref:Uncharacterized protein n=1 Tax=Octopus vulgaris TaxID=6645 RepID=A0AA36AJE6_OCTVU|nr:Hypothetical predicted protein [Octopus vulgaris]
MCCRWSGYRDRLVVRALRSGCDNPGNCFFNARKQSYAITNSLDRHNLKDCAAGGLVTVIKIASPHTGSKRISNNVRHSDAKIVSPHTGSKRICNNVRKLPLHIGSKRICNNVMYSDAKIVSPHTGSKRICNNVRYSDAVIHHTRPVNKLTATEENASHTGIPPRL